MSEECSLPGERNSFFFGRFFPGEFLLLVLFLLIFNLPFLDRLVFPLHDTFQAFQNFSVFYNEYLAHFELPLWFPNTLYGLPSDYYATSSVTPALFFMIGVGPLLGITDILLAFKVGLLFEQIVFLLGLYLFCRLHFRSRAAVFFVAIGALASIDLLSALYFQFRVYFPVPLLLFFASRFLATCDFRHAAAGSLVLAFSLIGNTPYIAPVALLVLLAFAFPLILSHRAPLVRKLSTLPHLFSPLTLALIAGAGLLLAAWYLLGAHAFDYTQIYSPGRTPDGNSNLRGFLTYASPSLQALWAFLYAVPSTTDFSCYFGLIPIFFILYGLLRRLAHPVFHALLLSGLVLLLFSLAFYAVIAPLTYYLIPGMSLTRHVGYYLVFSKILFLLAAGFGFDDLLLSHRESSKAGAARRTALTAGSGLAAFLLLLDLTIFREQYPLASPFFPSAFHAFALGCLLLNLLIIFLIQGILHPRRLAFALMAVSTLEITSFWFLTRHGHPGYQKPDILPAPVQAANRQGTSHPAWRSWASGQQSERNASWAACDNNPNTFWSSPLRKTPQEEYLELDLGTPTTISLLRWLPRMDAPETAPRIFSLFLSLDAKQWTCVAQETGYLPRYATWYQKSLSPQEARFLRLVAPGGSRGQPDVIQLAELGFGPIPSRFSGVSSYPFDPTLLYEALCEAFKARPGDYQPLRRHREDIFAENPLLKYLVNFNARYAVNYATVDSWCYQDCLTQTYRTDQLPRGLDRLIRASQDIPLDRPLHQATAAEMLGFAYANEKIMRAIGAEAYKLETVPSARICRQEEEAARLILEKGDFDTVPVVLARDPEPAGKADNPPALAPSPKNNPQACLEITGFSCNRLQASATVYHPQGVWLLYRDGYHPRWQAEIDGVPSPVFSANLAFKALRLPAGEHQVLFRFTGNTAYSRSCYRLFLLTGLVFGMALLCLLSWCLLSWGRSAAGKWGGF